MFIVFSFLIILFIFSPQFFFINFFNYLLKIIIFLSVVFDFYSKLTIVTVCLIFLSVLIFSIFYIKYDYFFSYFCFCVSFFVLSIIILCFSNSLFLLFVGWDGLGVTSFLLIIFYINWKRLNNRMFTLLSNRIGDGLILIFFGFILFNFFLIEKINIFYPFIYIIILLVSFTKRAQIPISAWLPAAISAPTPVRALVHSSTLVTAGVIVIIKFYFLLVFSKIQYILFFFGLITILMAGLSSLAEIDFKKLVALSTLSQMGLLIFILRLGLKWFCFFHLLSHAFFKRALFLFVGRGLHYVFSQQDRRQISFLYNFSLIRIVCIFICFLCLCGLFFTSGFISKDLFIDLINNKNLNNLLNILFIFSLLLTFFYSIRLIIRVFIKRKIKILLYSFISLGMELRPIFLMVFSLVFSYWMINNILFFYSSLIFEKKFFLFVMFIFFVFLFLLLLVIFFIKNIFFIDLIFKKFNLKKPKMFNKTEKIMLDSIRLNIRLIIYVYNIKYFFNLNLTKNLQILTFLFIIFLFFLFCLFSLFKV